MAQEWTATRWAGLPAQPEKNSACSSSMGSESGFEPVSVAVRLQPVLREQFEAHRAPAGEPTTANGEINTRSAGDCIGAGGTNSAVALLVTIGTTSGKHWAEVALPDGPLRVYGRGYGSPLPILARAMAEKGVSPLQRVNVITRTGTVGFANQPLGWWADRAVIESEARGAHFARFKSFDDQTDMGSKPGSGAHVPNRPCLEAST